MDGKNLDITIYTIPPEQVKYLGREGTLDVLAALMPVAEMMDQYEKTKSDINACLLEEAKKAEEIKNSSSEAFMWISIISIIVSFIAFWVKYTFFGSLILTAIVIAILAKIVLPIDLAIHREKNLAQAKLYFEQNAAPIQNKLNELESLTKQYYQTEQYKWAIKVVGPDMLNVDCINVLYQIVKTHRADTIKEALNKLDDEIHKARMERMQQEIQNATALAAMEAEKQTELAQQTADSSQATARYARQIARSLR